VLRQSNNPREAVEARIERQDLPNVMLFHHGQVHGVASRHLAVTQDNLFRSLRNR
jgi:hypothetical protein